LSVKPFNLI